MRKKRRSIQFQLYLCPFPNSCIDSNADIAEMKTKEKGVFSMIFCFIRPFRVVFFLMFYYLEGVGLATFMVRYVVGRRVGCWKMKKENTQQTQAQKHRQKFFGEEEKVFYVALRRRASEARTVSKSR